MTYTFEKAFEWFTFIITLMITAYWMIKEFKKV